MERNRFYLPVKIKFAIAVIGASAWVAFSYYIARYWRADLSLVVGDFLSFVIILFIALIPGFLNAHLLISLLLDWPPLLNLNVEYPPVSILIAAYNEEVNLPETFRSIKNQDYPGKIEVIVTDDGSTDSTKGVLKSLKMPNLKIVQSEHGGKAHALSEGLKHVKNDILVTIDADTFLHPHAIRRIIARLLSDPSNTAAVAGRVLVKNSRENLMTKIQEWDYFTSISSVKRQQSLYQGTMVAQGAFSAFKTKIVRKYRGWPAVIGEDIVLTWAFLNDGYKIGFESTAIGFTVSPSNIKKFYRQRKRWARGMIEGLRMYGDVIVKKHHLPAFFILVDFILPTLDVFFTLAFIPGLFLALTGRFYIVGPPTFLVLPLIFLIIMVMYQKEKRVFSLLSLKVRKNNVGIIMFMLVYQLMISPIAVVGYFQELIGIAKKW